MCAAGADFQCALQLGSNQLPRPLHDAFAQVGLRGEELHDGSADWQDNYLEGVEHLAGVWPCIDALHAFWGLARDEGGLLPSLLRTLVSSSTTAALFHMQRTESH